MELNTILLYNEYNNILSSHKLFSFVWDIVRYLMLILNG